MKIKEFIIKVGIAGIISLIILSIFTYFYYNVPIHYESDTYSTDYVWAKGEYYSRGTEGFATGKTDVNGFNNKEVPEQIDILVMGSSQMEGFNVQLSENTTAKLNKLLDNKLKAYNIGISGHTLHRCLNNLKNAIDEFKPNKYIIIEFQAFMTAAELNDLYNNDIQIIPSNNDGLKGQLQKLDYLRLLYAQLL